MKRLTSEFTEDYIRFALNRAPSHAEVLEESERLVLEGIEDRECRADAADKNRP